MTGRGGGARQVHHDRGGTKNGGRADRPLGWHARFLVVPMGAAAAKVVPTEFKSTPKECAPVGGRRSGDMVPLSTDAAVVRSVDMRENNSGAQCW